MTIAGKAGVSVLVLIILGLVAYGTWRLVPDLLPTKDLDGEYGGTVSAGSVALRNVDESNHEVVEGSGGCDVNLSYVLVEESEGVDGAVRDAINASILATLGDFFPADGVPLSDAATSFVQTCQRDLEHFVGQMDDPIAVAQQGWTTDITTTVYQNADGILSLGFSNESYFGGAHPNTVTTFLTFDLASGKELTLRDVIAADSYQAFVTKEKTWLVDNASELLFEESLQEAKEYLVSPTDASTDRFMNDTQFYLTPEMIVTFYNAYAIAPYASGPIAVELARDDIGAILNESYR